MKKIVFIVEKTSDGFSAYAQDSKNIPAYTSGDDMVELRANILDAYNSVAEMKNLPEATIDDINIRLAAVL